MLRLLSAFTMLLAFVGCSQEQANLVGDTASEAAAAVEDTARQAVEELTDAVTNSDHLAAALESQSDENKARYPYRHPRETLEFFGIEPGMTVLEALPGGGWYTKILIPYLGNEGRVIGADYNADMWPMFGFFSAEFIEDKKTWTTDWSTEANAWYGADGAQVSAFVFGSMPDDIEGEVDAVLFVRALHNLARFEDDGGFLSQALADAYAALKPGGIVGIVQHQAPEEHSDASTDGSRGYLKKSSVIAAMEKAGFEFVGESGINHNHKDQPTAEDIVWRLPPTLVTARENPELEAPMRAIGESHRMTLKFRKPT